MSPNVHQDCQGRQVKPGDFLTDSFITLHVVSLYGSGQFVHADETGALVTNFCCCFTVCPPPAHQGSGDSLAAPAVAVQGVCTRQRNAHQWRSISYFLSGFHVLARKGAQRLEGTRASGEVSGREAGFQALPDGNHGDNRRSIK